jgi:energy-coupling factor transporter ATP-binding protein EcfA2
MAEKQIEPAKTNNCCRKVRISKYKNLGINKPVEITINRTLDKDKIGGLVWLVGKNGAGKSNILKAVNSLGKAQNKRDYPRSLDDGGLPSVSLIYYDHETVTEVNSTQDNRQRTEYDWSKAFQSEDFAQVINDVYESKFYYDPGLDPGISAEDINARADYIREFFTRDDTLNYMDRDFYFDVFLKAKPKKGTDKASFKQRYGYAPFPSVVWYKEQHIQQKDFRCDKDEPNEFFIRLFSGLKDGKGLEKIRRAYEKFEKEQDHAALRTTERQLNNELRTYADLFNRIFKLEKLAYSFQVFLYESTIAFGILQDNESRNIEDESDGFRWFFDFFFNFRCGNKLNPGDIVLIEEPGTALHIEGRAEFASVIREYAHESGITFIMSTHEPCMLDPDYMDDVRIVFRKNKYESEVYDKFTVVDQEDPDQLNKLLKALTVGRHAILDPKYDVVFVEGITDYNYLTAFKQLLGISNLRFLPINGLGDVKDDARKMKIIESLMKIEKNPVLLVDDDGAGRRMLELSQKDTGVSVHLLSEANPNLKQIEDAFDKDDYTRLGLSKEWHVTSVFKQYIKTEKISETTMKNFKAIFDMLGAYQ